ncbi:MAG TPA: TfoX/Sxy family protein [Eudoraea sp.]|nr:TfoX/Sxy family protein [Eudoraea sp.]
MAYSEALEHRIDIALNAFPKDITDRLSKKKMFGGIAFLYGGKMTVGVVKEELMVRVISERMGTALNKRHVRPMDFTNRPMKEFVFVSPDGIRSEEQLLSWISLGIEHAKMKLSNQ